LTDRINDARIPTPDLRTLPTIDFRTGEAEALSALSRTAYSFSMDVQDHLDTEAKDGNNKTLDHKSLYAPSIRGQAYTQAALKTYQQRLDLDVRKHLSALEGKHATNPAAYQQAVAEYKSGFLSQIVEEARPQFDAEIDIHAQAAAARLDSTASAIRKAQTDGQIVQLEAAIERDITRTAGYALSDDPKLRAASQRSILLARERLEAEYGSTFTDRYGNKIPLYSPDTRAEAMLEFDQTVLLSSMRGWFKNAIDTQGGFGAVTAMSALAQGKGPTVVGQEGEKIAIYDELTEENRMTLLSEIKTQISFENTQQNFRQAQYDRMIDLHNEMVERSFMQGDDTLRLGVYMEAMHDPNADPDLLRRMESHFEKQEDRSDPATLRDTRLKIYMGDYTSLRDIPVNGLSMSDEGTLMALMEKQADADYFTNTNDFKSARDMLRNFYKVPVGATLIGDDSSVRAGWLGEDINDLYDMGLGDEELKPNAFTDRARALIESAKKERRTIGDRLNQIDQKYQEVMDDPHLDEADKNQLLDDLIRERRELRKAIQQ
jgi:hypothetical protein